jgi:hypothetical protein
VVGGWLRGIALPVTAKLCSYLNRMEPGGTRHSRKYNNLNRQAWVTRYAFMLLFGDDADLAPTIFPKVVGAICGVPARAIPLLGYAGVRIPCNVLRQSPRGAFPVASGRVGRLPYDESTA